jgi:hypothetical protein
MTENIDVVGSADTTVVAGAGHGRRGLRERGMVTIEYAIGAVLVLVLVGVVIASIQGGWFDSMVKDLVTLLMQTIPKALGKA